MVALEELIATKQGSVDPSRFPCETFELYSIPAYDSRQPEVLRGSEIGSAKQLVEPEDVLLSKIVPHIRRSWIVGARGEHRKIASGEWIVFRSKRFVPAYLRHALLSDDFHAQFMQTVSGVGGSLLRARPAQVAKIEIPLPSFDEQRRIAAILDKADALRAIRREGFIQLERLAQSTFVEMFGDPSSRTSAWPVRALADCCEAINDCPHSTPNWKESGYVCLRTSNLTEGDWNWDDRRFVSGDEYHERSKRGYIQAGDIVLSREGTVGVAAIVQPGMEVCMGQRLVQVRCAESVIIPEYLLHHLLHVLQPSRISQLMVGSTAQHLNVRELRLLRTPLPPLALQRQFAARVQIIKGLHTRLKESASAVNALFASLQQRAFAGQL